MRKTAPFTLQKHAMALTLVFVGIFITLLPAADMVTFAITRTGRKILHDGFLMEWSEKTAQKWDKTGLWTGDATLTPEGFAGYFRTTAPPGCSTWTITAQSIVNNQHVTLHLSPGEVVSGNEFRLDRQEYDSSGNITIEWLLPYTQKPTTNAFSTDIRFTCQSSCGDTLPVLHYVHTGSKPLPCHGTLKLTGQSIAIVILALIYFVMQRRIRRQKK